MLPSRAINGSIILLPGEISGCLGGQDWQTAELDKIHGLKS